MLSIGMPLLEFCLRDKACLGKIAVYRRMFLKKEVSILPLIFWLQQIGWSYCAASLTQFE